VVLPDRFWSPRSVIFQAGKILHFRDDRLDRDGVTGKTDQNKRPIPVSLPIS